MTEMMHHPVFFYAIAFFLFLAVAYRLGRKPIVQWLDSEIAKIGAELEAARQLRAEAETALQECKAKQADAEAEAVRIVEMAKKQAVALRKKAEDELEELLTRQRKMAEDRIEIAKIEAIETIREATVSIGMEMARKTLGDTLQADEASRLIDQAIADVPALKTAKA